MLALFYRILIIFAEKSVENVAHVNLDVSVCRVYMAKNVDFAFNERPTSMK